MKPFIIVGDLSNPIGSLNTSDWFAFNMAGNLPSPSTTHVVTGKGSSTAKSVSGVNTEEGHAMLVNDVGRKNFALPSHPKVSASTAAQNLLQLVKAAINAADTGWGMSANTDVADDLYAKRGFLFKAGSTNDAVIYIGTSSVNNSGDYGIPLAAGESLFIEVTQASTFWLCGASGGTTLDMHFLAI
jgi:hypothetical protein